MFNKKILLIIVLFIILTLKVSAVVSTPVSYWALTNLSDELGSYNLSNNGMTSGVGGILGNGYRGVDGLDYLYTGTIDFSGFSSWSVNTWFKPLTTYTGSPAKNKRLFMFGSSGTNRIDAFMIEGASNSRFAFFYADGGTNNAATYADADWGTTTTTWSSGSWYMVTATYDGSNFLVYVNGNLEINQSTGNMPLSNWNNDAFSLNAYYPAVHSDNGINADRDETGLWNIALNSSEITELYNSGSGLAYPFGSGNSASEINISTTNNTHTNDQTPQIDFIVNDADGDNVTCNLLVNNTLSGEAVSSANPQSMNISVNHTLSDGGYNYFFNCIDGTDETISGTQNIVVDSTNPAITWTIPANDNTTIYTNTTTSFDLNILLEDVYLFAWNVTIYDSVGNSVYSNSDTNLTLTSFTINDTINLSSLDFGTFFVNVSVSDDHTDQNFKPNKVEYIGNRLKIDDFISIMPENFDVTDMNYEILNDRITYYFTPTIESPEILTYEVECDAGLIYRPVSKYKGHFICGNYWLDFENPDDDAVSVNMINSKQAIVSTKAHVFNSIGGLNIVGEQRSFIYAKPINLLSPSPEDAFITYKDYVDFSVLGNFSLNYSCSLFINSSLNISTQGNSGNDINISFLNISFVDGDYDYYIFCEDSLSNDTTTTNTFMVVHANCTDTGYSDACSIYDNTTTYHIYDPSGCHVDYNETIACNYCSEDLQQNLGTCVNDNQSVNWTDDNFPLCCYLTGITSDCSVLYTSPFNITTYQSCDSVNLTQNFTCDIASVVEFKDRMPFTCIMPDTQEYKCVVNVYEDGRLLQTNPETTIYSSSLIGGKKEETREFFTTQNGLLNAYFTKKNLRTDQSFRVDAICNNGTITIKSQNNVNPFYDNLDSIANRTIWLKDNFAFIFVALLIALFVVGVIAYYIKQFNEGRR